MISIKAHREFSEGDAVVVAEGTYQGTVGTFLRLREDVKWADISEQNGSIRSHPVAWLALSPESDPEPGALNSSCQRIVIRHILYLAATIRSDRSRSNGYND